MSTRSSSHLKVQVLESHAQLASAAAELVSEVITDKPNAVLGLPTGKTPLPLYAELARRYRKGALDFLWVRTFNLDEFVGVRSQDAVSFRSYMERNLFTQVNLGPRHLHFFDGAARDLDAECARFDRELDHAGGLDLAILGIGANGHLAFNEPGDGLVAAAHVVRLNRATRVANAEQFGGDPNKVPERALTIGMRGILSAKKVLLLATGPAKAAAVATLRTGLVTTRVPATFLQLHPDVTVLLDRPAAGS